MPTHGHAARFNILSYAAVDERRLDSVLLMPGPAAAPFSARSGRRVNGAGLVASVSGSPENWTVTPGAGVIYDGNYATQGPWRFEIPAQVSGSIGTRPATGQSRIDLLVARILDTDVIGSGSRDVVVERVVGTAGSSPSTPTVPALSYLIATLTVPNSGSVTITPNTAVAVAAGGILPVATTAERDALVAQGIAYRGLVIDNAQVGKLQRYNGTAWKTLTEDDDTGWVNVTTASGVGGTISARRNGSLVEVRVNVTGTFANASSPVLAAAGAVPADLRPDGPGATVRVGAVSQQGFSGGILDVRADGSVNLRNDSGGSKTSAWGSVIYLRG